MSEAPKRKLIGFLRLDKYLIQHGMASTMTRAQELIANGYVKVNDIVVTSPICPVTKNQKISLLNMEHPWVSEDGKKLDHALKKFNIEVKGKVAVDIGAGIGGFSDVLLARGVKKIYAIEKEFGILHTSLILNDRVKNMDRTDVNTAGIGGVDQPFDLITYDLPGEDAMPVLAPILKSAQPGADLIALIQAPADLEDTPTAYKRFQKNFEHWLRGEQGWTFKKTLEGLPIGENPPREFFIWAQKPV